MAGGPLRWFRKYQKLMLGVFGVLLMIVFTLSFGSGVDPIIEYLSGGAYASSTEDPVVATWKGGALHSSQFNNLRQSRAMLNQLMISAQYETAQRNGRSQTHGLDPSVSDESLMQLVLLSREAERLGIHITDSAILNFLAQSSGGTMQPVEFLDIWKRLTGNSERQLLSILRTELAAQKVRSMAWSGHRSTSPVQFWDYFNQLERFVTAELMPIAVDDFVDEVPEPTEAELQDFYEQYKDRYAVVGSPEPGFKRRMRRAFDYVKVNYNLFLQAEMEEITDQQVAEYYEANKDDFLETLPASDLELGEADAAEEEESSDEEPQDNAVADDEESSDENDTAMTPDTESAEDESPETDAAEVESTSADANETEPPAGDESAENVVEQAAEAAAPDGSASLTPVPQEPAAPPAPVSEQAVEDAAEAIQDTGARSEPGPESSGEETIETTPAENADKMESPEATDGDSAPSEDSSDADESGDLDEKEKKVEYRPLEDVTDTIKERLAAETAQENFKNALSQIQSKMDRYYRKYVFWEMKKDKGDDQPPEMPDLAEVESPVPLNIQSMPLSDRFESAAYELGQQYDLEFRSQSIEQVPFSQSAYSENLPLFQPSVFPTGQVMTKFVYWVTAQEDAYTPDLDEIRDEVVRAWKLDKARELALAEGEKAAEAARAKGTKLSESCAKPGRNFLDSGEVPWVSGGSVGLQAGGLPQLSTIPGVEFPGPDMLRTMFRLREGEVGVALDGPQTTVYVIRVAKESPTLDQREQRFISEGIRTPAVHYLARSDNENILAGWFQDLMKSYDVKWAQDPSTREQ